MIARLAHGQARATTRRYRPAAVAAVGGDAGVDVFGVPLEARLDVRSLGSVVCCVLVAHGERSYRWTAAMCIGTALSYGCLAEVK